MRSMSMYPKNYVEPVVFREKQEEMKEKGELDTISSLPVRAALNYQTLTALNDPMQEKFINMIMMGGKKELARTLFVRGFENIKRIQVERYHLADEEEKKSIILDPRVLFKQAIENCRPLLQLTPIKRGGTKYNVPGPVSDKKSYFLAMKWLKESMNDKDNKIRFSQKFAWEILDAAANTGRVVKRKQDLHKQCEANRAYTQYRWR